MRALTLRLSFALVALLAALPAARADQRRPTLYLLTIGVSNYTHADGSNLKNLPAAAKDARDLAAALLGQDRKLYERIVHLTLTDGQATRAGVERALGRL